MSDHRNACKTIYALVAFICFALATDGSSLCWGQSRFTPLNFGGVVAISDDGLVVAGSTGSSPYTWTEAAGLETIPLQSGQSLFLLTNISGDGTTVVGGLGIVGGVNSHYESFSWTKQGGVKLLGRLPGNFYDWAHATAVSYDGSVIVGTDWTYDGQRAYRWTEATGQVELGTLGPPNIPTIPPFSEATDVSATGDTVVGFIGATDDGGFKAYRWNVTDGLNVIGLPGWPSSPNPYGGAYKISGDGQVIYGRDQKTGAWIWTEPSGFALLPSDGDNTDVFVHALSHDGSTLVGSQFFWDRTPPFTHTSEAAIWRKTAAGYEKFYLADALRHQGVDLQGWQLTQVFDVSADGRTLIGTGINPQGVEGSWYAVLDGALVPEPASAAMAIAAICTGVGLIRTKAAKLRRFRRPQVCDRDRRQPPASLALNCG